MYDQLRLEKYGLCCKMKVTTVVHILGWVGLVFSILETLLMVILPIVRVVDGGYTSAIVMFLGYGWYILAIVIFLGFFLYSLITRSILLKRNRARNFSGVKKIMKIICHSHLSLRLICGLIMLIKGILRSMALTNFEDLINTVDKDGTGNIDFPEFLMMMKLKVQDQNQEEDIRMAFTVVDNDGNGFIDRRELAHMMRFSGETMSGFLDIAATELPKSNRIIMVVSCIIWSYFLIFTCIGIHGVRKDRKNLINAFIINNIVEQMLFALMYVFSIIFKQYSVLTVLNPIFVIIIGIYIALLLSFVSGHFVVVYNMIDVSEEYGHEMRRV